MRAKWLAAMVVCGALTWGLTGPSPVSADLGDSISHGSCSDDCATPCPWVPNWLFGEKVAGTYLTMLCFTDSEGEQCAAGCTLLTIHRDGTFIACSEDAFGRPDMQERQHSSPWMGKWERTGWYTIEGRGIIIAKNEATAEWEFLVRQEFVADFSSCFNNVDIALETSVLSPCGDADGDGCDDCLECALFPPNPNTDGCEWVGPFPGESHGKRILVAKRPRPGLE